MINIAIDGPSASGKSSVSREVAKKLNLLHLNTGAIYRAFGLFSLRNNIVGNPTDKQLKFILNNANISVKIIDGKQYTFIGDEDVSNILQSPDIAEQSSYLSQIEDIRVNARKIQRNIAKNYDVLIEGRDIGTVIIPNADYKFYVTASVEERAKRRYKQLIEKGQQANLQEIAKGIQERDYKDEHRTNSPLKIAKDACVVDTTNMTFDEVVDYIVNKVKEK